MAESGKANSSINNIICFARNIIKKFVNVDNNINYSNVIPRIEPTYREQVVVTNQLTSDI